MLKLKDNTRHTITSEEQMYDPVLERIGNVPLNELLEGNKSLFLFPAKAEQSNGEIDEEAIFSFYNGCVKTGNIMGFVGVDGVNISITSRFSSGKDYFLHYLLSRVLGINILKLPHSSSEDHIWDFLLYLFPLFLGRALSQGLYKKYKHNKYNDSNIKGSIDIARHLREDIPFKGTIAHNVREHSYDNEVTQLIRHTIEHIKKHAVGRNILNSSSDVMENIMQIISATPKYNMNDRHKVLHQNIRPVCHPYFREYIPLQKLCLQLLKRKKISFGTDGQSVCGILFDGAWLWEEYLNTLLREFDFIHPQNKNSTSGVKVYKNRGYQYYYPDFYRTNIVLDAKYKRDIQREDYHQIITYIHILKAEGGVFIHPSDTTNFTPKGILNGFGGSVGILSFGIPSECESFNDFILAMRRCEAEFKNKIKNEILINKVAL